MTTDTEYANTDFDLKSETPFETLHRELDASCRVLHYTHGEDGHWHSIMESSHGDDTSTRDASMDILAMIDAINALSAAAKAEFNECYLREFNIGFHCWDTWAYVHTVRPDVVRAVADVVAQSLLRSTRCVIPTGHPNDNSLIQRSSLISVFPPWVP